MTRTRSIIRCVGAIVVGMTAASCGQPSMDARYPARPEGCDVHVFHEAPPMPTDSLGPARARCDVDVPDADCLRTLEDEVCKLGGDVVWGVGDKPEQSEGKNVWRGRAAHTRAATPAAPAPQR